MTAPLLVLTRQCPECGKNLQGLEQDRVYVCLPCARAHEVTEAGWQSHPLHSTGAGDLPLPFWHLRLATTLSCPEEKRACFTLPTEVDVWVKSFHMPQVDLLGNPGLVMTLAEVALSPVDSSARPMPLVGSRRSSQQAATWGRLFLLERLDRQEDISGITLETRVLAVRLVGMPFRFDGDALTCVATGQSIHPTHIDDFDAIRRTIETWRSLAPTEESG